VTQHVESADPDHAERILEVHRLRDGAPFFRVQFHNLGTPSTTRRLDVVLCNWADPNKPPTVMTLGNEREQSTTQPWKAACVFCKAVQGFFETMLDPIPVPEDSAKRILELRDKTAGNRALVTLLGF